MFDIPEAMLKLMQIFNKFIIDPIYLKKWYFDP